MYSLQFRSGIANGAGAIGYTFDTVNTLENATASVYQWRTGGKGLFAFRLIPGGGLFGQYAVAFDSSILNAGSEFGGQLRFVTPGSFGSVDFRNPGATFGIGISPGTASIYTGRSGNLGDPASLTFGYAVGGGTFLGMSYELGVSDKVFPGQPGTTSLGANISNSATQKWGHIFLADNSGLTLGNNADARLSWDATDCVLNPDLQAAGGRLRLNSASCWSASAGGSAPALHSNLPTGATGTTRKWLTVKDNAGAIYHIPAWSNT